MSIETFSPLPLTTFGTWLTLLDPSDVPPGMSPDCADVEFFPGGVRTRPGLVSQFAPLAGTPNVNSLKTYITTNLVQRLLVLDSLRHDLQGNFSRHARRPDRGPAAESAIRFHHAFRPRVHGVLRWTRGRRSAAPV